MGSVSQPLDFRKSTNNGATWSAPIRITKPGQEIRRAIIIANGATVHVFVGQSDANGYGTGVFYFRSTNGGANWDAGVKLYDQADASARMVVDGTKVHIAFGAMVTTNSFGGRRTYMRSANNGTTWVLPYSLVKSPLKAMYRPASKSPLPMAVSSSCGNANALNRWRFTDPPARLQPLQ